MKKLNVYVDMDGVLADFFGETEAVARFRGEKNFFVNLKPLHKNVQALRKAIEEDRYNIFVLTSSPHLRADQDKIKWLNKYVPELETERVIICRNGDNKADFMKTPDGILFDDYGVNIQQWVCKNGGVNRAVKIRKDGDVADGFMAIRVLKEIIINA